MPMRYMKALFSPAQDSNSHMAHSAVGFYCRCNSYSLHHLVKNYDLVCCKCCGCNVHRLPAFPTFLSYFPQLPLSICHVPVYCESQHIPEPANVYMYMFDASYNVWKAPAGFTWRGGDSGSLLRVKYVGDCAIRRFQRFS